MKVQIPVNKHEWYEIVLLLLLRHTQSFSDMLIHDFYQTFSDMIRLNVKPNTSALLNPTGYVEDHLFGNLWTNQQ